jgi:hypothetical protein
VDPSSFLKPHPSPSHSKVFDPIYSRRENIHFPSRKGKRRLAKPIKAKRKNTMKKCPFCSEDVQDEALNCQHCGKSFPGGNAPVTGEPCTECGTTVPVSRGFCPKCGVIHVRRVSGREALQCPSCRSSKVEKISAAKKAGYVAVLGIFAPAFKSVRSQFKCTACGNKW